MTTDSSIYYRVAVYNGSFVGDRNAQPLYKVFVRTCGHNHRTPEAAEACRVKLVDLRREGSTWVSDADWHGAEVYPTDRSGHHKPGPGDSVGRVPSVPKMYPGEVEHD